MTQPANTDKIAIFNCANVIPGVLLRGKRVTGDWQIHRVGCRDLSELISVTRGRAQVDYYPTLADAREAFNADMGEAGGYLPGWDFDRDTEIKPCTKKL